MSPSNSAQAGLFATPVLYPHADHPSAIATGDLNGDGIPDMVGAAGGPCGPIVVMLNEGDGHLAPPTFYAAGTGVVRVVALADLNGDGTLDVVVDDFAGNGVLVLLGDGTGRLGFPVPFPTGKDPVALAVGDMNGDRAADVVVANQRDDNFSVLLNDGYGVFAKARNYPTVPNPAAVALGDLDKDGRSDLVVAADARAISLVLNKGGGTLGTPVEYPFDAEALAGTGAALAVRDVDGDGNADVVATNRNRSEIGIFSGDGRGKLGSPTSHPGAWQAQALSIADMNADGRLDIAVGGQELTILAGADGGAFRPPVSYRVGATSMALADLNGDGASDVITANDTDTWMETWAVTFNNGDGTLAAGVNQGAIDFGYWSSFSMADVNGDGRPDLTAVGGKGDVVTVLNDGTGTFPDARAIDVTHVGDMAYLATGDWNGDGRVDLAITDSVGASSNIVVLRNLGNATFERAGAYATETGQGPVAFGDWNGDGRLDLAATNSFRATVSVFMNMGDGTFTAADVHPVGTLPGSLAVADLDGDGKSDLAVATEVGRSVSILRTKGAAGVFAPAADFPLAMTSVRSVALGDLNGDGRPDLVAAGSVLGGGAGVNTALNSGDGSFAAPVFYPISDGASGAGIGDLDGDGLPDIAVTGLMATTVLLNGGAGTFSAPTTYFVGSSPVPLLGDLNGDRALDLALLGKRISVSLNVRAQR